MTEEPSSTPRVETVVKPDPTLDAKVIDIAIRLGVLGLFAYFSLQLVAPFFLFLVWAVVLTVALYPVFDWLAARLGGRKVLAAVLITLCCLAIVIGPVAVLIVSLVDTLQGWYHGMANGVLKLPPRSFPVASQAWPLARAAADPPEDPPALRPVFHGLRVKPLTGLNVCPPAHSGTFDLAMGMPPRDSSIWIVASEVSGI